MYKENDNYKKSFKEKKIPDEESVTRYGEFVTSYFAWLDLNKQKSRANELNDITKSKGISIHTGFNDK